MFKGYIASASRKTQQRTFKNKEYSLSNSSLLFGTFGIKIISKGLLNVKELIPLRKFLMKEFKGTAKVWTRFLLEKVITQKPGEVRMGKGKGKFYSWVAPVKAGIILFEFSKCSISKLLHHKISIVLKKLSVKTRLITLKN